MNEIIKGLDNKYYGIVAGKIYEVFPIHPDDYTRLSEEERNNGNIYIIDKVYPRKEVADVGCEIIEKGESAVD